MNIIHQSQTVVRSPKNSSNQLTPNVLLRDARKQMRWTQKQLAIKVGVTPLTISRWERGETAPDSYARIKLCRVLNRSLEELWVLESKETDIIENTQSLQYTPEDFVPNDAISMPEGSMGKDHLSKILRIEREQRGWSQANLAERMGKINVKTIARWENGRSLPQPYYRQALSKLFGKSLEELGLLVEASPDSMYTVTTNLSVPCGDCGQSEITIILDTIVIDQRGNRTTFYFRLTNGMLEDAGLRFESVSLTNPRGDFFLGRSVGSFLLGAKQSIPLSLIFDWVPEQNMPYNLNVVLIRPNKWRNTYRPIPLMFKKHEE